MFQVAGSTVDSRDPHSERVGNDTQPCDDEGMGKFVKLTKPLCYSAFFHDSEEASWILHIREQEQVESRERTMVAVPGVLREP